MDYNFRSIVSMGVAALALAASPASAATFVEDFENFPAWKDGWLASNSNLENYYGYRSDSRGNNPDGLWLRDGLNNGSQAVISFFPSFGVSLSSFAMDVAGFSPTNLTFWDKDGATLFITPVTLTNGAFTDPGSYVRYSVNSSNGIGGFSFSGGAEGNTSIDNIVAITGSVPAVPEPSTWAFMLLGFGCVGAALRSAKRRQNLTVSYT